MDGINKKYNIEVEILTPLNIGAGAEKDWVRGIDYVEKDETLYKLNLQKMLNTGIDLDRLSAYFASKDTKSILKLVGSKLAEISDFTMSLPIESANNIKVFLKNQLSQNPILAGSSLKGSIRSILFNYLRNKGVNKEEEVFGRSTKGDEFMRFIKLSDIEFKKTELVNTKIFNLQKSSNNEWIGGWKHANKKTNENYDPIGFNTLYESLSPGEKSYGSIMLSEKVFANFNLPSFYNCEKEKANKHIDPTKKKKEFQTINNLSSTIKDKTEIINNISILFKIINDHTRKYLQKEKVFFETYPADYSNRIVRSIEALLEQIPQDNSFCILKMSAGSGFHSITGDWIYDDYTKIEKNGVKQYKSRKIAICGDSFSLMGFIKIRILTANEVLYYEREKKAAFEQKEKERMLVIKTRQERIRRQKEEEKKRSEYETIITNAELLFDQTDLTNALIEYQKAQTIYPEGKKHTNRINDIKSILEHQKNEDLSEKLELEAKELFEKEQYSDAKKKFEEAQALGIKTFYEEIEACIRLIKVLNTDFEDFIKASSIKACAGSLKKWIKIYSQLTDEDIRKIVEKLKSEIVNLNKSKQKEWKDWKKWNPIIDIIGEYHAKEIYNSLYN